MSNAIRIIRAKHDSTNPYFMCNRHTAQDTNLSWEARGLLIYLLSKPDDWEVMPVDLQQKCGKNKVYRIINELKDAGYLTGREKYQDEKGHWHWTPYYVHERPVPMLKEVESSPFPQKPDTDKPDTENGEIIHSTEQQNTDNNIQPPKPEPQKDVEEDTSTYQPSPVQELEKAYCDVNDTIYFSNGHKELDMLRAMVAAGVTSDELREFVTELKTQDFWKTKRVSLKYIAENIGAWKTAQANKPIQPKVTITLPDGYERVEPVNVDGKKYRVILPEDAA